MSEAHAADEAGSASSNRGERCRFQDVPLPENLATEADGASVNGEEREEHPQGQSSQGAWGPEDDEGGAADENRGGEAAHPQGQHPLGGLVSRGLEAGGAGVAGTTHAAHQGYQWGVSEERTQGREGGEGSWAAQGAPHTPPQVFCEGEEREGDA